MESSTSLQALSLLVEYLAWSGTAFISFILLAKLADSGRRRFQIWLSLVIGLLACWVLLEGFPFLLSYTPSRTLVSRQAYAITHVHAASLTPGRFELLERLVPWAEWIYVAGLVVFAARAVLRLVHVRKILRHAQLPSAAIQETFDRARGFNSYRGCTVRILAGLGSPATIGWIRPRILLPDFCATDPNDSAIEEAVRHELKHIQRGDALWTTMAQVACVVLWFNPVVWLSVSRMNVEREFACDEELVTDMPCSRASYAECLVYFARMRLARHTGPILGLTSPPTLTHRRILAILTLPNQPGILIRLARTTASATLLFLLPIGLAGLRFNFQRKTQFFNSTLIPSIHALAPLHIRADHHRRASRFAELHPAGSENGTQAAARISSPTPPNEKLIAEHRTALDILTYSTMGDTTESATTHQEASPEGRVGTGTNSRPEVSWKSIALGAAQGVAGAAHGHDRDDH